MNPSSKLENPNVAIDLAEANAPEIFSALYPKRYDSLGAYHSPKLVSAHLTLAVLSIKEWGLHKAPAASTLMAPAFGYLVQHKMPTFFIAPNLLEALKLTDFKESINWVDLRLPFESAVFILPRNGLVSPNDGDVAAIIYSRRSSGIYNSPFRDYIPRFDLSNSAFATVALCHDSGVWFDGNFTADTPNFTLNNAFVNYPEGTVMPLIRNSQWDHSLTPEDSLFLEKIYVVLFGTFLALNARPHLLTNAFLRKRITPKFPTHEAPIEYWSPNIIGQLYKNVSLRASSVLNSTSHKSPRMHWRRGHFRSQSYGPHSNPLHKIIWLEPMLVASEAKATDSSETNDNQGAKAIKKN